MLKNVALLTIIYMFSCNTPEARLERLQHNFWEKFAQQDFFEIQLKDEVLHWPLPPASKQPAEQQTLAETLQKEANSIVKEELSPAGQKQLLQIRAVLDDCVANAGAAFFDPSRFVVTGYLEQFSNHPELPILLENIPAYYTQVEQQWQTPDTRYVSKAVAESQSTLDLLNGLGKTAGSDVLARTGAAQAAIKDFIGLCQSAFLK
ncbi:MAG: hypothetical protein Q7T20_16445 [Saprospiraceae bacterium]|nr:hypothetical protein [Saprospiraceae bacterium]